MKKTDVLIVGGGLAGLVAATHAIERGRRVTIIDQEARQNLGGQAFWSLGGLFMVDTPEQRRLGIKDSPELALSDWMGSAAFDRAEDNWPRQWAEKFVDYASGPMRAEMLARGMKWFPAVGWAERGGSFADGHGNSVPRFHITWGTGPGVLEPFVDFVLEAEKAGKVELLFRHRSTDLRIDNGRAVSVAGEVLENTNVARGEASSRAVTGSFEIAAESIIITSGGIGGNFERVRQLWPADRLGPAPTDILSGVPAHVDGDMVFRTEDAGAKIINRDRMWHYCEGVRNHDPIWPHHGIRILPGPSSIWLDAYGERMAAPALPGFDTMGTLKRILSTGYSHSWFILTQKIIEKEFALSGSEQNHDFTSKSWKAVIKSRGGKGATPEVEAFKEKGADFVLADDLEDLVAKMNGLTEEGQPALDPVRIRRQIEARDMQLDNKFGKDLQVTAIRGARGYMGDKLMRTAKPHRILDPAAGPLIGVKLHVLTRKTLGGLETDLQGRVFGQDGKRVEGLFAAGEASGFGGGGYHGYNALEGTFLGGCIFSGKAAGDSA